MDVLRLADRGRVKGLGTGGGLGAEGNVERGGDVG